MPLAHVNSIVINYIISSPPFSPSNQTLVLINGLADDLHTWSAQVSAYLKAGYRVLRYDNRGIGLSSRPQGPYTAAQLATDLHALLHHLSIVRFHVLGVSMGGMVAQAYALRYPNGSDAAAGLRMSSLSLCCTYAQPTRFCGRMFALWADMAARMGVRDVMRDVALWAFTVSFFREREAELREIEEAAEGLDMRLEEYLAQLNVIQTFDVTDELRVLQAGAKVLGGLAEGQVMVLAGEEDILIPVQLSKELAGHLKGAVWMTSRGGHGCMVSVTRCRCTSRAHDVCSGSFQTSSTRRYSGSWRLRSPEQLGRRYTALPTLISTEDRSR